MKTINQTIVCCLYCHAEHTLHEYEGMNGSWYSAHLCVEEREYILNNL